MNIYKLKYPNKETAISDLLAKGVYIEDLSYGQGTHAIVELGLIVDVEGTYDDEGNEITPPTFIEGWHVDIMLSDDLDLSEFEVFPKNPKHKFFEI
jgi:hypothetical protein